MANCRPSTPECPAVSVKQAASTPRVTSQLPLDLKPPTIYKRLVARRTGDRFQEVAEIDEVKWAAPSRGQVGIKVLYAGINGGCETFRVRGEHTFSRNREAGTFALGAEGAGVVIAVGETVDTLEACIKVGQHVTFLGGAFAEYVTVPAATCWPVQEACPEVVALTISGLTACGALQVTGAMRSSDRVLVTAAAGGTGHFAVQLAKLEGCHVVATCGSETKARALRQLGADCVINHRSEDVGETLRRKYPGGIDLVYEGVGGAMRRAALDNLAPGGRMLVVGYISEYPHNPAAELEGGVAVAPNAEPAAREPAAASGGSPDSSCVGGNDGSSGRADGTDGEGRGSQRERAGDGCTEDGLPPSAELFWGGQTVRRGDQVIYGSVWPKDRAEVLRSKRRVFELHEEGRLVAWIDTSASFCGLESVPRAIEHMLSGSTIGKVVVRL